MALLQVILFLLLCAVALGWVARHFQFPYPIALVIGGGAPGFLPRLPQLQFDPQVLLVLVLPPILFQAAPPTSPRALKAKNPPTGPPAARPGDGSRLPPAPALKVST